MRNPELAVIDRHSLKTFLFSQY